MENNDSKELEKNLIDISSEEKIYLNKMMNRLINLNQRNKFLFTGKINKKKLFDLTSLEIDNLFDEIVFNNKKICLCSTDSDYYKDIKYLIKENNRFIKEYNNNILYIGYPYVQGKLVGEQLSIKAPLMLFPVKVYENNSELNIELDHDGDIIYNTTLILANNKSLGKNVVLPNGIVENIEKESFLKEAINFFEKFNIILENNDENEYIKFNQCAASIIENDSLKINHYLTCGLFENFDTSLHRDFYNLIEKGLLTTNIKNLMSALFDGNDKDYNDENEDNKKINNCEEIGRASCRERVCQYVWN